MTEDWIIEILNDLRTFAQMNGLDDLATQLEQTLVVASQELSARPDAGAVMMAIQKLPPRH